MQFCNSFLSVRRFMSSAPQLTASCWASLGESHCPLSEQHGRLLSDVPWDRLHRNWRKFMRKTNQKGGVDT